MKSLDNGKLSEDEKFNILTNGTHYYFDLGKMNRLTLIYPSSRFDGKRAAEKTANTIQKFTKNHIKDLLHRMKEDGTITNKDERYYYEEYK